MIIAYKNLSKPRKKLRGKTIVFASGSFDLLHAGHILFLEECKKLGDVLVVAVGSDADIKKFKGEGRPIIDEKSRLKLVSAVKVVDYAFLQFPAGENVLDFLGHVFKNLKPQKYVINDDAREISYRKKVLKASPATKLVILKRRGAPPDQRPPTFHKN